MAATWLICGLRRALGALVGAFALSLVFAGTAFAHHQPGHDNGGGCNAPGNAYGHDNCDPPSDPPPPPTTESTPPPVEEPAAPPATPTEDPSTGGSNGEQSPEDSPTPPANVPAEPAGQEAPTPSATRPDLPPTPPPAEGWALVVARPERPAADPAPPPAAARRTFSSAVAPEASWGSPEASWSQGRADAIERYGVTGTSAIIGLRRGAGVVGGLAFRVQMTRGHSTFAFRASRSIVAGSGGRLYRIGAWLRSDVPGLSVCLRIQEVSPRDKLMPVRTSESCLATTAKWKHFKLYRRTLARGNRLVFSIYSYGAVEGDSFDVHGFTVSRRVKNGWKRVTAAFGKPTDS
jgi:hypothetical protein